MSLPSTEKGHQADQSTTVQYNIILFGALPEKTINMSDDEDNIDNVEEEEEEVTDLSNRYVVPFCVAHDATVDGLWIVDCELCIGFEHYHAITTDRFAHLELEFSH